MALEVKYEGLIDGTKNAVAAELTSASAEIVPGRICVLTGAGAGNVKCATLTPASDTPYGLVADYKADVIASGKITVYLDGVFFTDQTSGVIAKGNLLTFTSAGLVKAVTGGAEYVVGVCTDAASGDNFIEMKLIISGLKA